LSKLFFVYIITNKNNTVLYTGVTNNLKHRIYRHKKGIGSKFTMKYKVNKLLYFESYENVYDAISREKQIKAGSRNKKLMLINKDNPKFTDLYYRIIK
jgi:putative endonuclease